jgi:hypothetical protein
MTLGQKLIELHATQNMNGRTDGRMNGRMDGRTMVNLNAPPKGGAKRLL